MEENFDNATQHNSNIYNQKAIWSLILGILSITFCGFTGIAGWVLAVIARKEIRANQQQGDGLALAGLILSIIGTVVLGLILFVVFIYLIILIFFASTLFTLWGL